MPLPELEPDPENSRTIEQYRAMGDVDNEIQILNASPGRMSKEGRPARNLSLRSDLTGWTDQKSERNGSVTRPSHTPLVPPTAPCHEQNQEITPLESS